MSYDNAVFSFFVCLQNLFLIKEITRNKIKYIPTPFQLESIMAFPFSLIIEDFGSRKYFLQMKY